MKRHVDWPTLCRLGFAFLFVVLGIMGLSATVIMCVLGHRSLFEGAVSILLDLMAIIGGVVFAGMYWKTLRNDQSGGRG